jgi:hypothetical protein
MLSHISFFFEDDSLTKEVDFAVYNNIAILQLISKSFNSHAFDSHPLLLLRKANKHFFQRNLLYLETGNLLCSHLGLQKRKYL